MGGDHTAGYLAGLPDDQAADLDGVNGPGLTALRSYLDSGAAVAFLGAGVSAPLYPLWDGLIGEVVDAAAGRLEGREVETCRALAHDSPEEVVEIVRQRLGTAVTARCCGTCSGPGWSRSRGGPGSRCRNWCAGARSRPWSPRSRPARRTPVALAGRSTSG